MLTDNNISLPPLIEKNELNKISFDLLNYLINIKKTEGRIKYNNLDEEYINFRMRAAPYGRIRGKYYEAIVLDSSNILEIISYIMKDNKGRIVLFNEKIKYIGIACGFFENGNNKICTIIDMVQDFELNDLIEDSNMHYKNETHKNPEIFMRIKTIFKDKDELLKNNRINTEKSLSLDRNIKSFDRIKKYQKFTKNFYDDKFNKSYDQKKIIVNKSPLLSNNKINAKTYSTNFYLGKSNSNNPKSPLATFKSKIPNKKLSFKNSRNNSFFSSKHNFNKLKEKTKQISTTADNLSEKNDENSATFSRKKNSKKN